MIVAISPYESMRCLSRFIVGWSPKKRCRSLCIAKSHIPPLLQVRLESSIHHNIIVTKYKTLCGMMRVLYRGQAPLSVFRNNLKNALSRGPILWQLLQAFANQICNFFAALLRRLQHRLEQYAHKLHTQITCRYLLRDLIHTWQ